MIDAFETWSDMADRHAMERAEAVCALRDLGLTQAQAARKLEMTPQALNEFIGRNGIYWPSSKQGPRK